MKPVGASRVLRAGAAQSDITCAFGTQIAGDIGRRRPAEIVREPLRAGALVLESGKEKLCIVSLDVAVVAKSYGDSIRKRASKILGTSPEAIMIHAVQNHAAPSIGHYMISEESPYIMPNCKWLCGGDDAYAQFAVERILEAISIADKEKDPVEIGTAKGLESRVAFNRRFVMTGGKVRTHPVPGDPEILYCEGPIDPEVGVMCFVTESLRMPAVLLHFTCHPTHGYPLRYITHGWPGAWRQETKPITGPGCVSLVLNGCCGNVHHANPLNPDHRDDYRIMGKLLAETAGEALKRVSFSQNKAIAWKTRSVKIPIREISQSDLAAAQKLLKKHREPMWRDKEKTAVEWDWVYAVATMDLYEEKKKNQCVNFEVQVFRIGDNAVIGVNGEPFVELQLRVKEKSPAKRTFFAHYSNGFVSGYVPTKEAFARGGYETRTANWSKLAPDALDMIQETALELLEELF